MMQIDPLMDKEYRDWRKASRQRLARKLENLIGFELTGMLFDLPFTAGFNFGVMHSLPRFSIAIGLSKPGPRSLLLGMMFHCGNFWISSLGAQYANKHVCEDCKADYEQAVWAQARVIARMRGGRAEDYVKQGNESDEAPTDKDEGPQLPGMGPLIRGAE